MPFLEWLTKISDKRVDSLTFKYDGLPEMHSSRPEIDAANARLRAYLDKDDKKVSMIDNKLIMQILGEPIIVIMKTQGQHVVIIITKMN